MDTSLQPLLLRLEDLADPFQELREGVQKAVRIAAEDPDMALTRARKVLEFVIRDVYERRIKEPAGTKPLENLLQRLVKDSFFPDRLDAYANTIRKLGNVGTHKFGEKITVTDVQQSLRGLGFILQWYFEVERPDAFSSQPSAIPVARHASTPEPQVVNVTPAKSTATGSQKFIDRIIAGFDQAIKQGEQPSIEKYLRESPQSARPELFEALLRRELTSRLQRGTIPPLNDYVTRFPDQKALVSSVYRTLVEKPTQAAESTAVGTAAEWFFLRNRMPVGPFTLEQMQKLAAAGDLRPRDQVSRKGTVGWSEAATVQGLFRDPHTGAAVGGYKPAAPAQWIRDDYVLLEVIGRGGMGEVFKAFRFGLQKEVALKIVRHDRFEKLAPANQQRVLESFQKELRATAQLHHDYIISIHDTGTHNGLPFYTMDLGESSLAQLLHAGPLPARKAAEYLEKIARAVAFAHQCGCVHRDIKPQNILLVGGKPLLADLGLAVVRATFAEGQTGEIAGSPPYMAPEQVLGQPIDHRADIYGVGATLYHLITGRPPYQAADREQIYRQVVRGELLPPRRLNPTVDRDLEAITLKCLERDREKRYQNTALLAEDLDNYLQRKPIHAKRPKPWERLAKWARREKLKAGLAGCLAVMLLVLFMSQWISNVRIGWALETAKAEKQKAEDNAQLAAEEAHKAKDARADAEAHAKKEEQARERADQVGEILFRRLLFNYKKIEDGAETLKELKEHAKHVEQQLRDTPQDVLKLDLAETYLNLAKTTKRLVQTGQLDKAASAQAIEYLEKGNRLQGEFQRNTVLQLQMALNFQDLGELYGSLGKRIQEMENDKQALDLFLDLQKKGLSNPAILSTMADNYLWLGWDYNNLGDRPKAIDYQKKGIDILKRLIEDTAPTSVNYLTYMQQLGRSYQELGISTYSAPKDVKEAAKEALPYFDKAGEIFRGKSQYRKHHAEALMWQGKAWVEVKDANKAVPLLANASKEIEQALGELPENSKLEALRAKARILSALARAYHLQRDLDKAKELFEASLVVGQEITRKPKGSVATLVDLYNDFHKFYKAENQIDKAVATLNIAIEYQEAYIKEQPDDITRKRHAGILLYEKGVCLFNDNQFDKAYLSFLAAKKHEVDAYKSSTQGPDYVFNLYLTYQALFTTQLKLNDYAGAVRLINERMEHWPNDSKKAWEAAKNLANVYQLDKAQLRDVMNFLDNALKKNLVTLEQLATEPSFRSLRETPEYTTLVRNHAKN